MQIQQWLILFSFANCSTTTQQTSQNSSLSPQHDSNTWLDGLNSPLIQDEGDNKMLKLRFDVSQYTPEEIVVKTVDNKLLVSILYDNLDPPSKGFHSPDTKFVFISKQR